MYAGDSVFNYLGKTPIDSFIVPNIDGGRSHRLKLVHNNINYEWYLVLIQVFLCTSLNVSSMT